MNEQQPTNFVTTQQRDASRRLKQIVSQAKPHLRMTSSHMVPLDFSFLEIESMEDLLRTEARSGKKANQKAIQAHQQRMLKQQQENQPASPSQARSPAPPARSPSGSPPAAAFSPIFGLDRGQHEPDEAAPSPPAAPRYVTNSLRLCNNQLTTIAPLMPVLDQVVINAEAIAWIDLSFNRLTRIDPALLSLPNLRSLHLHKNDIDEIFDVQRLSRLKHLRSFTLFHNPVEQLVHYRLYVLSALKHLTEFDFSPVTPREKAGALHWRGMNKVALRSVMAKTLVPRRPRREEFFPGETQDAAAEDPLGLQAFAEEQRPTQPAAVAEGTRRGSMSGW
eukprot:gnl/Trimastix_PCT/2379.p1 GENE.gnl/Trimastix_PCT/2379~~gnl/Trimastix_PCT/2379.p1  ORF type:complete len:334 (+),score=104.27 gnl/Trimastix_PCT/2379:47-1048(+)